MVAAKTMPTKTGIKSEKDSSGQGVAGGDKAAQSPLAAKTLRHLQTAVPAASRASAPPSSTGVTSAAAALSAPAQQGDGEGSTAALVAPSTSETDISQPSGKTLGSQQQQNARRATTSSPLPPDLLSASQAASQGAPPTLATEILPAPPALPYDPSYPPLNPQAASGVLPFPLAATPLAPTAGGRPGLDVLVNGQPSAAAPAAPPHAVPHPSAQDKKRKQPVYSLATPEGYEGVMPWALYAIVNGKAEALERKGSKSKRRRGGGKAVSAAHDGRNSRSATPNATTPAPGQAPSEAQADSRPQSALPMDMALQAASSDVSMADVGPEPVQSTKSATGVINGDTPQVAPSTENGQAVDAMSVTAVASSLGADITSSGAGGGIDAAQAPGSRTPAQDHGAALAPTARSDGQKSDRDLAQASRLDQLPNTSTVAPSTLDGEMASSGPQDQDITMAEDGDSTQEGNSSGRAPTGKRATAATKKRRSTQTTKAPVTTTDGNSTPSRASSVSRGECSESGSVATPQRTASTLLPGELSGPSRDVLALSASPTLASLSAARPTRAAVAKVAARGSYYDASTYEAQSPIQAAAVKNLQTTPRSTSANRRVNGSASRTVATSASSVTGTPTPTSKAANGKGKEREVDSTADGKEEVNEASLNEDFCSTCRGTGHFICCDSCPRSFHFACVNPPLDINEVPLDDNSEWHCRACSAQRRSSSQGAQKKGSTKQERRSATGGRFFACLVEQVENSNPSIFALPPDIKSFFKNVASAVDGSYQDLGRQRAIKADRKGLIEERDPYRLKDAKGKDILCYQCGQSALPKDWNPRRGGDAIPNSSWRSLVSCDYCSLHWHLDCLNPPRASVPSSLYKWRCPCHIEDLLVKTRTAKASTQLQVVDLPVPTLLNTGFGPGKIYRPRVLNSGVIDIVPDPMDTYFSAASSSDTSGRSLHPGWMNGGRADIPPLVDGEIPGGGMRRVKFRLPEKVVRTDWWMKVLHGGRDALVSGDKRGANAMDFLASIATDELEHQGEARDLVQLALTSSQPASLRAQPLGSFSKPQDPPRKGFVAHPGGKLKREEDEQWAESAMRGSLHLVDDEGDGGVAGKAKANGSARAAAAVSPSAVIPSSSSESDLTDLSDDEAKGKSKGKTKAASSEAIDDAATPRSGKRAKLVHASDMASSSLTQEELESLLAVRELMRKKGEGKLMNFLMAE